MIIGIDLSLSNTGIAILGNKTETKSIKVKSYKTPIERLIEIKNKILDSITGNPLLIVIEDYAYSTVYAHKLGELGGVVKVAIKEKFSDVNIVLVPPTILKKFVTGKGNAEKNIMILHIYKKWKREFSDNNQADAFALAKFGEMLLSMNKSKKDSILANKIKKL